MTCDRIAHPRHALPLTVVMITRNRRWEAKASVERLLALPEPVAIVVVDNGSTDGTVGALERCGDRVRVVALDRNAGAAGRNLGVAAAQTPYVAFVDDDSAWAPGSLRAAVEVMEREPRIGLVAARVLVGAHRELDPTCRKMAVSPVPAPVPLPGPAVLGFIACGAVVRRDAFVEVGGFAERYGVGGEEGALAIDLAARGWCLTYVADVVALHWPSPRRDTEIRRRVEARNALWLAWSRRRLPAAIGTTARCLRRARTDPAVRAGVREAMRHAGDVIRTRRCVDRALERQLRLLE